MNLQPGDVFVVGSPHWMSRSILKVEKLWAKDRKAEYGHAGIITSADGDTFEALWTLRTGTIWKYGNDRLLVARPTGSLSDMPIPAMDRRRAINDLIQTHGGQRYPAWRLALHLIPPLARRIGRGKYLVCSELTAKYLWMIGARGLPYLGTNPDDLADEWMHWRNFEIVYLQ